MNYQPSINNPQMKQVVNYSMKYNLNLKTELKKKSIQYFPKIQENNFSLGQAAAYIFNMMENVSAMLHMLRLSSIQ
jgi:hypothetical protein